MTNLDNHDFIIMINADALVKWDKNDKCIGNSDIKAAFDVLEMSLDPVEIYLKYSDNLKAGSGDVHLYKSHSNQVCVGIDYYRLLTDQYDSIKLFIHTDRKVELIKHTLRNFFDSADYQFSYQEGHYLSELNKTIQEANYPKLVKDEHGHVYEQHIQINYMN